ncbi:memo-like protein [Paramyrothecium foliicola]|nr:memo-like protein [Paramyrothecium foliicola]
MVTRAASHANSWYTGNPKHLRVILDEYLSRVPDTIDRSSLPIPGARIIIAPHAGYDYSGPCAAWAYSCLDLSRAKRVFVLGPSHKYYLDASAVSVYTEYATPFGNLTVDTETIQKIKEEGEMEDIPRKYEFDEHSLEMHMPYLYLMCERQLESEDNFPQIVPMLIGSLGLEEEQQVGHILAPYLKDPENAFIISSDFCHWGDRSFSYTPYSPDGNINSLKSLSRLDPIPKGEPIHETIRLVDEAAMDAVKSGSHVAFVRNLRLTKNTVCGRHPIGVAMAAMELCTRETPQESSAEAGEEGDASDESEDTAKPRFSIIKYDRSNLVERPGDFSVSYVSAYAVL